MAGSPTAMPVYAFMFMGFTMANVGLPGNSGFIGEFLSLIGSLPRRIRRGLLLRPSV